MPLPFVEFHFTSFNYCRTLCIPALSFSDHAGFDQSKNLMHIFWKTDSGFLRDLCLSVLHQNIIKRFQIVIAEFEDLGSFPLLPNPHPP